jgi:hypothetical protein
MYDHYTEEDESLIEAQAQESDYDGQEFLESLMFNGFDR